MQILGFRNAGSEFYCIIWPMVNGQFKNPLIPMHDAKMKGEIKTTFYENDGIKQNGAGPD